MRTKEFLPLTQAARGERIGVVLMNQVGASIAQDHGRDAHYLAEHLGLPVLAVERPGSNGYLPSRRLARELSTPYGYQRAMVPIGREVNRWANEREHDRLVLVGRSAGALGVLALAASKSVSGLEAIFAAEPIGFETMSLRDGAAHLRSYRRQQAAMQRAAAENPASTLVLPERPGLGRMDSIARVVSNTATYAYDQYHNEELWASNAGEGYATYIADYLPDVDTTIEFARYTMAARRPHILQRRSDDAMLRRRESGEGRFSMGQIAEDTTHASYDKRSFMLERLLPTFERLGYVPEQVEAPLS